LDAEHLLRVRDAFLVSLVISIFLGGWVALVSHRADQVRGGTLSHILHYLGAIGVVGTLPGGIAAIALGAGFLGIVIVAVAFVLISVVSLWLYALVEHPARAAHATHEDRGWTEQDARKSGL
jgi:hypothetical protein